MGKLLKKRLLVHVDVVKEFYAKMTRDSFEEKDVVKSKVRGVDLEFDNEKSATILGRRVRSVEMKPSQRFIHFLVMKNVIPRFGKRDTSSFMDLTYMDHLMARRLVNLPRVMMRHMSYVISMKDHESPHGDWLTLVFEAFGVPLVIKKEKNQRNMISLKTPSSPCANRPVEDGIWWIGSGENRRRDDDEAAPEEEAEGEDEGNQSTLTGRR
ncbi:hypothetical protein Dimus_003850 [Dionaea muscipula]